MFYHQHFIFVDIYLNGPMLFYLGQIVLIRVIIHHNLCQFRTLFVYVTK